MPSDTEQIALRDVPPVTMGTHSGDRTVRTAHRSLGLGLLLAVVGGFLDAFTYVGHGHVFANTMSGNVVLVGVSIVAGQWTQAIRSLTAVVAFLAGVAIANLLHLPWVTAVVRRPKLDCLRLELAFLLIVEAGGIDVALLRAGTCRPHTSEPSCSAGRGSGRGLRLRTASARNGHWCTGARTGIDLYAVRPLRHRAVSAVELSGHRPRAGGRGPRWNRC